MKTLKQDNAPATSTSTSEPFETGTEKIVSIAAWRLIRSGKFQQNEEDDLQQELRIAISEQEGNYNPRLSSRYTYITMVCNGKFKNMLKERTRSLRKGACMISLDEPVGGGTDTLGDHISAEDYRLAMGRQNRTDEQLQVLKEKVDDVLALLPEEDVEICRQIKEGCSLREIARNRNCSFTTLLRHFNNHLKPLFTSLWGDEA